VSEQLSAVLDELAARFGATGAELWRELVRYEIATAATTPVVLAFVAIGVTVGAKKAWEMYHAAKARGSHFADSFGAWIITAFAGLAWAGCVASLAYFVVVLSAPQAAVIRGLLP
jgi:ABC-type cobalamin transport system permease subunit